MSTFPWDIFALGALLAVNRFGLSHAVRARWTYWTLQAIDALGIVAVLAFGLKGTERFPIVRGFVAVVIAFHIVQNFAARGLVLQRAAQASAKRERQAHAEDPPPTAG